MQRPPGNIGTHAAITQDKMGQHGKYRSASGALNAPNGEATEANASIMGVASQRAAAITGRFVMELETDGEDEGQHELDEHLASAQELRVGGLIVEIDGEGAVFACLCGGLAHVFPPDQMVVSAPDPPWG